MISLASIFQHLPGFRRSGRSRLPEVFPPVNQLLLCQGCLVCVRLLNASANCSITIDSFCVSVIERVIHREIRSVILSVDDNLLVTLVIRITI